MCFFYPILLLFHGFFGVKHALDGRVYPLILRFRTCDLPHMRTVPFLHGLLPMNSNSLENKGLLSSYRESTDKLSIL